jgi:hypothetical protein
MIDFKFEIPEAKEPETIEVGGGGQWQSQY